MLGGQASDDTSVYQHPSLQQKEGSRTNLKEYDVYTLGDVLLEMGLWDPLSTTLVNLPDILTKIENRAGRKYRRVVEWCLSMKGNGVRGFEFVVEVLVPFKNLVDSLV